MSESDPDGSTHGTTNDCSSNNNSEHPCVGTPMPSVQSVLDDIQQTFGHMPPLPPSELALKLKVLRERQDNIYGDTVDFDSNEMSIHAHTSNQDPPFSTQESTHPSRFDDSNDPDFSNQECSTNSRFADRPRLSLTQEWRNFTPKSKKCLRE